MKQAANKAFQRDEVAVSRLLLAQKLRHNNFAPEQGRDAIRTLVTRMLIQSRHSDDDYHRSGGSITASSGPSHRQERDTS